MLTPWLPPPLLTQDILSIPDMMQHSPLYLPWIRISVWKRKTKQNIQTKKQLIQSSRFSPLRAEKRACSLEEDEETNALLIAL